VSGELRQTAKRVRSFEGMSRFHDENFRVRSTIPAGAMVCRAGNSRERNVFDPGDAKRRSPIRNGRRTCADESSAGSVENPPFRVAELTWSRFWETFLRRNGVAAVKKKRPIAPPTTPVPGSTGCGACSATDRFTPPYGPYPVAYGCSPPHTSPDTESRDASDRVGNADWIRPAF